VGRVGGWGEGLGLSQCLAQLSGERDEGKVVPVKVCLSSRNGGKNSEEREKKTTGRMKGYRRHTVSSKVNQTCPGHLSETRKKRIERGTSLRNENPKKRNNKKKPLKTSIRARPGLRTTETPPGPPLIPKGKGKRKD